jgi:hypothetical protein
VVTDLELAESIATEAFTKLPVADQYDIGGRPYVDHFARVAARVEGDWTKQVAWLHDVIEDTDVKLYHLGEWGIGPLVIEAVALVTHEQHEPYRDYIDRIWRARYTEPGGLAYRVKIADLCDNLDVRRAVDIEGNPVSEAQGRLRTKHQMALDRLLHGFWSEGSL